MCGIVGYVGPRSVVDVLIPGLARLEYRGYDSAGIAIQQNEGISVVKKVGRIAELERTLAQAPIPLAHTGIGHTRWATHGVPNTINAHPHRDCGGDVIVVHNGIIENWSELKSQLLARGHEFASDTDTEVVAHMIEEMADLPLDEAVRRVMKIADGSLALVLMRTSDPDLLVGARSREPACRWQGRRRELHRL